MPRPISNPDKPADGLFSLNEKSSSKKRRKCSSRPISSQSLVSSVLCSPLEGLPGTVLCHIMDDLSKPDLLQICLVSKSLHRLAVIILYQRIMYSFSYSTNGVGVSYMYTITQSLDKLADTLAKNENLASLVKTFVLEQSQGSKYPPTFHLCKSLNTWHCKGAWKGYPPEFWRFKSVTCHVSQRPMFSSNLTHLRLMYTPELWTEDLYKSIADAMILQGLHVNLHILVCGMSPGKEQLGVGFMWSKPFPTDSPWLSFFSTFASQNSCMKSKSLSLNDNNSKNPEHYKNIICSAVDLESVQTLELIFNEGPPQKSLVDPVPVSILSYLISKTSSLENLHIDYERYFEMHDSRAVLMAISALKRDSLKEVNMQISNEGSEYLSQLQDMILTLSRKLVKLSLLSECLPDSSKDNPEELEFYNASDCVIFGITETSQRDVCFNFTEYSFLQLKQDAVEKVRSYLELIARYTATDPIYSRASTMPFLTEYHLQHMHFDMKADCLIMNGEAYPLAHHRKVEVSVAQS